ncbi:MAG: tRNA lysidine(34) synthetase TilS [Acidobacteriota bacterium]|nr:tRNA lysidine(34) synthetase TilS [Acidobacteriota bacterium]
MNLVARVHAFAARHRLWTRDTRVLAAVSGGSDSVALLLLLHHLGREGHLRLAGAVHLHHHIRPVEADADAAFVQQLAARLDLPCEVGHADVPALARAAHQSLEVAGRRARLGFFERALSSTGADRVAVAHTKSDQAETVLLRLARGAGPRGMAGMAPLAGHRIRPLLDVSRTDVRAWLRAQGQTWRDDATNEDVSLARNRVRHEVLPALAAVNARVEDALARAARIFAADAELLDELARAQASRLVARDGETLLLDLQGVGRLPEALARRVVLGALDAIDASREHGWDETEAVLHGPGVSTDLGRVRVERNRQKAVLFLRGLAPVTVHAPDVGPWVLPVPGMVRHLSGWWQLDAAGPMAPDEAPPPSDRCAVLDADAVGRHLTVRCWRAGDRVQPLGLGGRKKLQDVFVDRKVPRDQRALVPVVVDGQDRIAWVAGLVVGEPFRVTPRSSAVVVLTLRR